MYKMGHILDRYVIRNMLFSYVIVFAVFIGLWVVIDLFSQIDEFTESLLPAGEVVQNVLSYYGYRLFPYYQDFAGPIVVFAALFTLFRIRRANETVAIMSSGVSLHRLLWPVALVGIGLNSLLIINQELIIPRIADKLMRTHDYASRGNLVEVQLQTDQANSLLLGSLDPQTGRMTDVLLVVRDARGNMIRLQQAPSALWDGQRGGWTLHEAVTLETAEGSEAEPIKTLDYFYATELSPRELQLRASTEYLRFQSTPRIVEMAQQPYIQRQMGSALDTEKHFRFTNPLVNVVILLLTAPLIISREPKSVFLQMIKGLLVIMGAFALAFVCQQLSGSQINPLLAAWLPVILFGPAAVVVLDSVKT